MNKQKEYFIKKVTSHSYWDDDREKIVKDKPLYDVCWFGHSDMASSFLVIGTFFFVLAVKEKR